MQMINVTDQILKFRNFLVHSWRDLDLLMSNHDWDDDGSFILDWLQANWEFFVERELLGKNQFLVSYRNTDIRITHPLAKANYRIICISKTNVENNNFSLFFGGFVTRIKGGFGIYPPFDFVTAFIDNKRNHCELLVEECEFFMIPLDH